MPQNTGYKGFANRRRLINGVPDGYTEPNVPGPNYVPPILDETTCPPPAESGILGISISTTLIEETTIKVTRISDDEVLYEATHSGTGIVVEVELPAINTKDYRVEVGCTFSDQDHPWRLVVTDEDKGAGITSFDTSYVGDQITPLLDTGDYNTDISILITNDV